MIPLRFAVYITIATREYQRPIRMENDIPYLHILMLFDDRSNLARLDIEDKYLSIYSWC